MKLYKEIERWRAMMDGPKSKTSEHFHGPLQAGDWWVTFNGKHRGALGTTFQVRCWVSTPALVSISGAPFHAPPTSTGNKGAWRVALSERFDHVCGVTWDHEMGRAEAALAHCPEHGMACQSAWCGNG